MGACFSAPLANAHQCQTNPASAACRADCTDAPSSTEGQHEAATDDDNIHLAVEYGPVPPVHACTEGPTVLVEQVTLSAGVAALADQSMREGSCQSAAAGRVASPSLLMQSQGSILLSARSSCGASLKQLLSLDSKHFGYLPVSLVCTAQLYARIPVRHNGWMRGASSSALYVTSHRIQAKCAGEVCTGQQDVLFA